ncbi:MAG: riboflavin synthase [Acidobacteriota bacterium]
MFTGIVEELGKVKEIRRGSLSCQLDIGAAEVLSDVKMGDSIAVNGVCLTVVAFNKSMFTADVMPETMKKTGLDQLLAGNVVNLERAMKLGDRMGGHIVSGHVDGVGRIIEQNRLDIALVTRIACQAELLRYIIPKGSVAIDGISLTVVDVMNDSFTVSLIPHTAKLTTLGWKKPGDTVNLETDVIGKYVERLLMSPAVRMQNSGEDSQIDLNFLRDHGFSV